MTIQNGIPISSHRRLIVCLLWLLGISSTVSRHQVQAEEIAIDPWVIPLDNIPYPTRSAVQGDVVSFHYRGNHNVYVAVHSDTSDDTFRCDTLDATEVGASGSDYANYTLTMSSDSEGISQTYTTVTFFCNYTVHCERGQQLKFNIYASREDIPPTQAPSTIPTLSPTTSAPSMIPTVQMTAPPFVSLFDTTFAPTSASGSSALRLQSLDWNLSGWIAWFSILVSFYPTLS